VINGDFWTQEGQSSSAALSHSARRLATPQWRKKSCGWPTVSNVVRDRSITSDDSDLLSTARYDAYHFKIMEHMELQARDGLRVISRFLILILVLAHISDLPACRLHFMKNDITKKFMMYCITSLIYHR